MRFRRVTLLVMIYLALDLANPMMPGAFQLVDGSLETVPGCQARGAAVPAPVVAVAPRDLATVVLPPDPGRPAVGAVPVVSGAPRPQRLLASSSTRASSPDDD